MRCLGRRFVFASSKSRALSGDRSNDVSGFAHRRGSHAVTNYSWRYVHLFSPPAPPLSLRPPSLRRAPPERFSGDTFVRFCFKRSRPPSAVGDLPPAAGYPSAAVGYSSIAVDRPPTAAGTLPARRRVRGICCGVIGTALNLLDFGRRKSVKRAQRRGTILKPDKNAAMTTPHSRVRVTKGPLLHDNGPNGAPHDSRSPLVLLQRRSIVSLSTELATGRSAFKTLRSLTCRGRHGRPTLGPRLCGGKKGNSPEKNLIWGIFVAQTSGVRTPCPDTCLPPSS